MAQLSITSGTRTRRPVGNRYEVTFEADEVTNGGDDYIAAADIGLSTLDSVSAVCKEAAVAVRAQTNSQDFSDTSNGDLALATASGTHDVYVRVVGR